MLAGCVYPYGTDRKEHPGVAGLKPNYADTGIGVAMVGDFENHHVVTGGRTSLSGSLVHLASERGRQSTQVLLTESRPRCLGGAAAGTDFRGQDRAVWCGRVRPV